MERGPDVVHAAEVKERALALGFAKVGIARATALDEEGARLRQWVQGGKHGSMRWLADTVEVRIDPGDPRMLEGATSVIVMVAPYARQNEPVGPAPGIVARYARGRDYHNVLGKRMRSLVAWLRAKGHRARAGVDSMPIYERAWAQRAGVGFIGKNCCLIVPGIGSHVFLATIVTTAALEPDAPMQERCGSCTRCLDGCPTRAFDAPRVIDSRRCISYLTIEHDGAIDPALRAPIGDRFLGCDVCQDVCPFNRTSVPDARTTEPFAPHPRWRERDAAGVLCLDEQGFDAYSLGSPVRRLGRARAARNAAIVLGNAGERRHLPVLREAAEHDADPEVRASARWAIERLEEG